MFLCASHPAPLCCPRTQTPLYQAFFFSVMGLFEGRTIAESISRCVRMLPSTVPASWEVLGARAVG